MLNMGTIPVSMFCFKTKYLFFANRLFSPVVQGFLLIVRVRISLTKCFR